MSNRARASKFVTVLATAASIVAIAAIVLAAQGVARTTARTQSAPAPIITTHPRVGTLRQHVDVPGDIKAQFTQSILAPKLPADTSPVITWLPKSGQSVNEGGRLLDVADQPVFALTGSIPMYRPLAEGVAGPDVLQLQNGLSRLGYQIFDKRSDFGPSTALAVYQFLMYRGIVATDANDQPVKADKLKSMVLPVGSIAYTPSFPIDVSAACGSVGQQFSTSCTIESTQRSVSVTATSEQSKVIAEGQTATVTFADGSSVVGQVGSRVSASVAGTGKTDGNPTDASSATGSASGEAGNSSSTTTDVGQPDASDQNAGAQGSGIQFSIALKKPLTAAQVDPAVQIAIRDSPKDSIIVPMATLAGDPSANSSYVVERIREGDRWTEEKVAVKVGLCTDGECAVDPMVSLDANSRIRVWTR